MDIKQTDLYWFRLNEEIRVEVSISLAAIISIRIE